MPFILNFLKTNAGMPLYKAYEQPKTSAKLLDFRLLSGCSARPHPYNAVLKELS